MHDTTAIKKKNMTIVVTIVRNRIDPALVKTLRMGRAQILNPDKRHKHPRSGGIFQTDS